MEGGDDDASVAALLSWARAAGASLSKTRQRGRALVLCQDLAAREPFLELPAALLLRASSGAGGGGTAGALAAALAKLEEQGASDWTLLCLRVAAERALGAASFWAPYLDALPAQFTDPLWWPDKLRASLGATPLAAAVADQVVAVRELRKRWAPALAAACEGGLPPAVLAALGDATALRWARSAVATRAFMLPLGGGRCGSAMVPVGDLLDHNPFTGADWQDDAAAAGGAASAEPPLRLSSPVALRAGEQPCLSYGARSNAQLLLTYGFCLHPNPHDSFSVSLAASGGGIAPGARRAALRAAGLSRRAQLWRAEPLPPGLMATLRICLAPDAAVYAPASAAEPPCRRTEARAVATLRRALSDSLAVMATHADADDATLQPAASAVSGAFRLSAPHSAPAQPECWGCDSPMWALAAYRAGQAHILRAAKAALAEHAGLTLLAEGAEEAPAPPGPAAEDDAASGEAFVAWLEAGGATWPCLTRASVAACGARRVGAGWVPPPLVLSRAVAAGDVLATVPAALMLSADDTAAAAAMAEAAASNDAAAMAAEVISGDEEALLAFALAWHRHAGADSSLAPLLRALDGAPPPLRALAVLSPLLVGTSVGAAVHSERLVEDAPMPHGDGPGTACEAALQAALRELLDAAGLSASEAASAAQWGRAAAARLAVPPAPRAGLRAALVAPLAHGLAGGPLWGAALDAQAAEDGSGAMQLVALVPLPAGAVLRAPATGVDAAQLLLADGAPEALLACKPSSSLASQPHVLEICLQPQEEDPQAEQKAAVLEASGLAGAHYLGLTPPSSPEECPLLAVLALLLCDLRADPALRSAAAAALAAEDELRRCDAAAEEADAANVFIPQDARDAVAAEADIAASRAAAAAAAVMRALSAANLRATALNALCGMLGDAAEELAPLEPAVEAAVAAAAAEAGVGPAWVAAARAHRAAQAEIVGAWCRTVDSWLTAMAREANNRKRARAMAAERAAAPPAAAAEA